MIKSQENFELVLIFCSMFIGFSILGSMFPVFVIFGLMFGYALSIIVNKSCDENKSNKELTDSIS